MKPAPLLKRTDILPPTGPAGLERNKHSRELLEIKFRRRFDSHHAGILGIAPESLLPRSETRAPCGFDRRSLRPLPVRPARASRVTSPHTQTERASDSHTRPSCIRAFCGTHAKGELDAHRLPRPASPT